MKKTISIILGIMLLFFAFVPGGASATLNGEYDSDTCRLSATNVTRSWFNYSDDENGRSYMEKENASLNASFRVIMNTTACTVDFYESNLKTIMIEGHPPPDFMSAAEMVEFKQRCKDKGTMSFTLHGNGTNTWVFMDMPSDIVRIVIDNNTFDDYTYEDNNLTITMNMSTHTMDVIFGGTTNTATAGYGIFIFMIILVLVVVIVFMMSKSGEGSYKSSSKDECEGKGGKWNSKKGRCKRK